jgi:hypothetical protein
VLQHATKLQIPAPVSAAFRGCGNRRREPTGRALQIEHTSAIAAPELGNLPGVTTLRISL